MTPPPHPLRCETCDNKTGVDCRPCKILVKVYQNSLQIGLPFYTSIIGCASHSAAPRPAPSPTPYDFDVIGEFCKTARAEAAAQAREDYLNEIKVMADGRKTAKISDVEDLHATYIESLRRTGGEPR